MADEEKKPLSGDEYIKEVFTAHKESEDTLFALMQKHEELFKKKIKPDSTVTLEGKEFILLVNTLMGFKDHLSVLRSMFQQMEHMTRIGDIQVMQRLGKLIEVYADLDIEGKLEESEEFKIEKRD